MFSYCFLCGSQLEEYDMMVRELGFEMKAQPSEKMKTPEELAREEREKLQKLEVCSQCEIAIKYFLTKCEQLHYRMTICFNKFNTMCDTTFFWLCALSRLTV